MTDVGPPLILAFHSLAITVTLLGDSIVETGSPLVRSSGLSPVCCFVSSRLACCLADFLAAFAACFCFRLSSFVRAFLECAPMVIKSPFLV